MWVWLDRRLWNLPALDSLQMSRDGREVTGFLCASGASPVLWSLHFLEVTARIKSTLTGTGNQSLSVLLLIKTLPYRSGN